MSDNSKKAAGWAPVAGTFETLSPTVHFTGGEPPAATGAVNPSGQKLALVGLALSSQEIVEGDVSADVVFESVSPNSTCHITLAYDMGANWHLLMAGIGGPAGPAYSIREFGGQRGAGKWFDYITVGDRTNIKSSVTYHLELKVRGSMLTLLIDGVIVGQTTILEPPGRPRQVGLFFGDFKPVVASNFKVVASKPRVFMLMQFGQEFDAVYRDVVKDVCEAYAIPAMAANEVAGPGLIISDIIREINEAQLVIADITPMNANVYFEVGYALALKKPMILLARKDTSLPFDVAGFRVLFYENTIGGKKKLEEGLKKHLDAILAKDSPSAL